MLVIYYELLLMFFFFNCLISEFMEVEGGEYKFIHF